MIKWTKGFITGIFAVSFAVSIGLLVLYKAILDDYRDSSKRRHYRPYY